MFNYELHMKNGLQHLQAPRNSDTEILMNHFHLLSWMYFKMTEEFSISRNRLATSLVNLEI